MNSRRCCRAAAPLPSCVHGAAPRMQVAVLPSAPVLFAICGSADKNTCWDNPDMVPYNNYYIDAPGARPPPPRRS